jgi:prevent-host-death family protein
MSEVGIRELKARASELVREVREQHAQYVVTSRGKPVALLSPLAPGSEITSPAVPYGDGDPWAELESLGEALSAGWSAESSSAELLSSMRR